MQPGADGAVILVLPDREAAEVVDMPPLRTAMYSTGTCGARAGTERRSKPPWESKGESRAACDRRPAWTGRVVKAPDPLESAMHVRYHGKIYEVAYTSYLGRDSGLYGLKSRFLGGSVFPAKKRACRPVKGASPYTSIERPGLKDATTSA